jgi:hypothetical protein
LNWAQLRFRPSRLGLGLRPASPPPIPLGPRPPGRPGPPPHPPLLLPLAGRHRHLAPKRRRPTTLGRLPVRPLSSPKRTLPLLLPLPLFNSPSFKAEMAGVMAPLGHRHRRIVRPPPSPWAPIKGTPTAPHLVTPHTTLLSTPLTTEHAPTMCLHRRRFAAVARPLHHRSVSSEGTLGTIVSPSPSFASRGNR